MSRMNSISRREFLRQTRNTALGVGAGLALPNIFLNKTKAATGENPSELIRLGFIGVGRKAGQHLNNFAKQTFAVCDVDKTHLADAKARIERANAGRACAAYEDYRKLLEDKSVDAVVIVTPDHWHALPTIHACEAGKDVYCEKPLTLTIAEGQAMVKAARRTKKIVQTGSQQRSDRRFRLASELVRSGRLGKIKRVEVGIARVNFDGPAVADSAPPTELNYDFWLGPAPERPYNKLRVHYNFRFFWDYSGGQMTNWGAHHLDIVQWALGLDESGPISAEGKARYHAQQWYEVPEWCEIEYKYPDDITVVCGQGFEMGAKFIGEKGSLYVNRGTLRSDPAEIVEQPLKDTDVRLYVSEDHFQDWFNCIKTRKLPVCDVSIGHRSATVCHLGNIALRSGKKVTWDAKNEQIVGDKELAKWADKPYRAPWKLG